MKNKELVIGAIFLALAGVALYRLDKIEAPKRPETPIVQVSERPLYVPNHSEEMIIEAEPIVIKAKPPVLHGTKLCRWYERAGIVAAHEAGDWLESTCEENTCFLMIHETTVPAAYIMAGWLSEARDRGRDPRKDGIELSVFTFRGGEPFDHVIYFPSQDLFDGYDWDDESNEPR